VLQTFIQIVFVFEYSIVLCSQSAVLKYMLYTNLLYFVVAQTTLF